MCFGFPIVNGFAVGLWVRGWESIGLRIRWQWVRGWEVYGLRITCWTIMVESSYESTLLYTIANSSHRTQTVLGKNVTPGVELLLMQIRYLIWLPKIIVCLRELLLHQLFPIRQSLTLTCN